MLVTKTSGSTGYAAWSALHNAPGTEYTVKGFLVGDGSTMRGRYWLYDGNTAVTLTNWLTPPEGGQEFPSSFVLAHTAKKIEIRLETDGSIKQVYLNVGTVNTHYRIHYKDVNDGQGGSANRYTYDYEGPADQRHGPLGRSRHPHPRHARYTQFRGHQKVTVTDPSGAKTETTYYQDDIYNGRPATVTQMDANSNLYAKTRYSYGNRCIEVRDWDGVQGSGPRNSCTQATIGGEPPGTTGNRAYFVYKVTEAHDTYDGQRPAFSRAKRPSLTTIMGICR